MKALIPLLALALPAQAEGRNDAFLRCAFADIEITLAESGGAVVWREGTEEYPAACLGQGAEIAQCIGETDPPALVLLDTGQGSQPFGTARLLLTDSDLDLLAVDGTCEALLP